MGNQACCSSSPPALTVKAFKESMESSRTCIQDDKPEVWVFVKQFVLKEKDANTNALMNVSAFQLEGVQVDAELYLLGTNLQIVQEIGSELALRVMDKVGVSTSIRRSGNELTGKVAAPKAAKMSLVQAKEREDCPDKVGEGRGDWEKGREEKTIEVSTKCSLVKEIDEEEVMVTTMYLETQVNGSPLPIKNGPLRKHFELALAKRATELLRVQA